MSDWFFKQGGRHRLVNWLRLDSWIDSNIAEFWEHCKDRFNATSGFFARFKLRGWRRLVNELASESLTLGVGGLLLVYALALPAFKEIDQKNWLAMDQFSVTFQDKDGKVIGKRGINLSDTVPLEEIPDFLIKAALATEDRRFFEHIGIDFLGTARALVENLRANDVVQGGSTLTQQLAKNLFLSPERSITRKLKEVFLSLWLESRLTKRQILKLYLDRAYMGGGAFGVEAASQFYFGKSVRRLTMAEAAMLAGLFKAPTKYAPHVNLPASRARASEVLSNLVEAGFYTSGQVYHARLHPAKPIETRDTRSPDWFLDYAYQEIQKKIHDKGDFVLVARTTIDSTLQDHAERALQSHLSGGRQRRRDDSLTGALVSMENDGAVRALVGGLDYGESQFNRATAARRQPGSSFKVYVYAKALAEGYTSRTLLRDSAVSCGRWSPRNYNGSSGSGRRVTMADALRVSLNTTAVAVSLKVGRRKVIELTQQLGITGIRPSCSMALGDTGISPLEHTGGFASFANGGTEAKPYAIQEVYNSKGVLVYSRAKNEPKPIRVHPEGVAEQMNQMMLGVVTSGTARSAQLDFTHAVGKTGTSSSYRDAWFMGFTGRYVTGVWVGKDNFRPVYRPGGRGMTGGSTPASIWQAYMSVAHENMDIPTIPGLDPHPTQVAEQQRLAALRAQQPASERLSQSARERGQLISKLTKTTLERLALQLRKASGLETEQDALNKLGAGTVRRKSEPAGRPGEKTEPGKKPSTRPAPVSRSGRQADAGRLDQRRSR
ncbi:MAG TPA: PBP1A family penicillin-binding protein [Hyphomicrobiaceae bacterium]|nr:PBP1A family penicillin-binding protein [Hyphomicrobiaceae bacterium]